MTKLTAIVFRKFANASKTQQTLQQACCAAKFQHTKNLYPAVQLQIPNREVSHSNLGSNTKYPAACRGLPQSTVKG
jgi:hypothetical protein